MAKMSANELDYEHYAKTNQLHYLFTACDWCTDRSQGKITSSAPKQGFFTLETELEKYQNGEWEVWIFLSKNNRVVPKHNRKSAAQFKNNPFKSQKASPFAHKQQILLYAYELQISTLKSYTHLSRTPTFFKQIIFTT